MLFSGAMLIRGCEIGGQLRDVRVRGDRVVGVGAALPAEPGESVRAADGGALPDWLVFDAVTGTFSGTPAAADVGNLVLTVTAADVAGASVADTFVLAVNPAPGVMLAGTDGNDTLTGAAGDDRELLNESADLLYHLSVLLHARGRRLEDVMQVLGARAAENAR